MSPLRPSGLGIMLAAAAAVAGGFAVLDQVGWLDWLFLTVVLSAVGLILWLGARAGRQALSERRRMAALWLKQPGAVALAAVREERRRLSEDIVACLQKTLKEVDAEVSATLGAPDPVPGIQRIRHHTQVATSELRRQLGLLRAEEASPDGAIPSVSEGRGWSLTRIDWVIALLAVALAILELVFIPPMMGVQLSWASFLLTVLAAGTIVGRRTAPGIAALACALLFLAAIVLQAPIEGGFWSLITVGGLLWTIGARANLPSWEVAGGAFLALISSLQIGLLRHQNLGIWLAMVGVSSSGGLIVRIARGSAGSSRAVADAREAELRTAALAAVSAERQSFARELHDVVSHAVGLIAVQSAAAEVAWPTDPVTARESLRLVGVTAGAALAELGSPSPLLPPGERTVDDLLALVERIRSAGTPVELHMELGTGRALAPEVFRTVQEGLTNVVRHAPGATASVSITADEHQTVVVVSDDGPADEAPLRRGYGLVGLGERVAFAGGLLEIGPEPGCGGFRVAATIPTLVGQTA